MDEAHAIKNVKRFIIYIFSNFFVLRIVNNKIYTIICSQRYLHLQRVAKHAERRLLLTGTPIHNSLGELWALLNFLMPKVVDYDVLM